MFLLKKNSKNLMIKEYDKNNIYSPIKGRQVPLESVNDPVFAEMMMGDGVAIIPTTNEVYSPATGFVSVVFPTKHAIGIEADNGARIIIHIGIETVNLNGKGFDIKINQGDRVEVGQYIGSINLDLIKKQYDSTTMIVIENSSEFILNKDCDDMVSCGDVIMKLAKES